MKIGFIGAGNMGGAIIKGYSGAQRALNHNDTSSNIFVCDSDIEKARELAMSLGINKCDTIEQLVSYCNIIFLAVKPNVYQIVLEEVNKTMTKQKVLISMAAGITMDFIQGKFNYPIKIIRIMPNTPALVNESMTAVCMGEEITQEDQLIPMEILRSIGKVELVTEDKIHAIIGVSGSSPAYAYMFIEAIARAGEKMGLDYDMALKMAAQSVLGASKMILETGRTPNDLVDMVCSPNGTTIEAVNVLRNNGFKDSVSEGVFAAIEKSIKMSETL
jgi:pyrroline-5-carboxylate reductase